MTPRIGGGAVALALVFFARMALAQEPIEAPPIVYAEPSSEPRVESEVVFYGGTTALLYGIGYTAGVGGFFLSRRTEPTVTRTLGAIFLASGGLTTIVGAPLTHWHNDNFPGGAASLFGQLGSVGLGIGVGIGVAAAADRDRVRGAAIGAFSAHGIFALVDVLALSRQRRVLSVETSASLRPWVAPALPGGFVGGLSLRL